MTFTTDPNWEEALRERCAETARRRALRAEQRRLIARRRAHGMIERNALRLAQARGRAGRPSP